MNKFIIAVLALAVLSGLSACKTRQKSRVFIGYNHSTSGQAELEKDRYACIQEAMAAGGTVVKTAKAKVGKTRSGEVPITGSETSKTMPSCSMINSCLAARGYTAVRNGGRLRAANQMLCMP